MESENILYICCTGFAAGAYYTHTGGGSNYLCLPRNPEWGKTTAGFQSGGSLYGAEYQTYDTNDPFPKVNGQSLNQNDVPCAVCLVANRPIKLMIPARLTCPDGWTKEYSGYLMAQHTSYIRTTYVCVDTTRKLSKAVRQPKWRPVLQRRGGLWFTALS